MSSNFSEMLPVPDTSLLLATGTSPRLYNCVLAKDSAGKIRITQRPRIEVTKNNIKNIYPPKHRATVRAISSAFSSSNEYLSYNESTPIWRIYKDGAELTYASPVVNNADRDSSIEFLLEYEGVGVTYVVGGTGFPATSGLGSYLIYSDRSGTTLNAIDQGGVIGTIGSGSTFIDAAVLNGTLYLLTTPGDIWNMTGAPALLTSTNVLRAERTRDKALGLYKVRDTLIAVSDKSIEVFYDAANPTGSPLRRRENLVFNYNITTAPLQVGDILYFKGEDYAGSTKLFKLENYQITELIDLSIYYMVRDGELEDILRILPGPATSYIIVGSLEINNRKVLVYDTYFKAIYIWETTLNGTTASFAPINKNTHYDTSGTFINTGGYTSTIESTDTAEDSDTVNATTAAIAMEVDFAPLTLDTSYRKYGAKVRAVGDFSLTTDNYTLEWADTVLDSVNTPDAQTVALRESRYVRRLPSYRRYYLGFIYLGTDIIYLEGLEFNCSVGNR